MMVLNWKFHDLAFKRHAQRPISSNFRRVTIFIDLREWLFEIWAVSVPRGTPRCAQFRVSWQYVLAALSILYVSMLMAVTWFDTGPVGARSFVSCSARNGGVAASCHKNLARTIACCVCAHGFIASLRYRQDV